MKTKYWLIALGLLAAVCLVLVLAVFALVRRARRRTPPARRQ